MEYLQAGVDERASSRGPSRSPGPSRQGASEASALAMQSPEAGAVVGPPILVERTGGLSQWRSSNPSPASSATGLFVLVTPAPREPENQQTVEESSASTHTTDSRRLSKWRLAERSGPSISGDGTSESDSDSDTDTDSVHRQSRSDSVSTTYTLLPQLTAATSVDENDVAEDSIKENLPEEAPESHPENNGKMKDPPPPPHDQTGVLEIAKAAAALQLAGVVDTSRTVRSRSGTSATGARPQEFRASLQPSAIAVAARIPREPSLACYRIRMNQRPGGVVVRAGVRLDAVAREEHIRRMNNRARGPG